MQFEKRKVKVKIKSPLQNFCIVEQEIEFRKDPLIGKWSRINIHRTKRPIQKTNREIFQNLISESRKNCPFCEENLEKSVAKFVDFEEKMKFGESIIFPNLFPYGKYHAVVLFSAKKHFMKLEEFKPKLISDAIQNSLNFFKKANEKDPAFKFPSINFNFMPPSAASIFHPHLQILLDDRPTFFTQILMQKSLEYFKKNSSNYWFDLIEKEKKEKERFIGETGSFCWLADFSPIKNNQVSGIVEEKVSALTSFSRKNIKDLALGLSKILSRMGKIGVESFNMCIFSGPMDEDISDYFLVNLKMLSRPSLSSTTTDIGFMELIQQESVVETLPEEVAEKLRFKKRK